MSITPQAQMKTLLEKSGIPYKQVECYGSQIVVTAWSRDAADKWAHLICKFATFRGIVSTVDYAKENKNTVLRPSTVPVWRVFGRIA